MNIRLFMFYVDILHENSKCDPKTSEGLQHINSIHHGKRGINAFTRKYSRMIKAQVASKLNC